jgi:hypothetical protein
VARPRKALHVVTIPLKVPLQLGESQVMGLKCEEPQAAPRAGKHGYQPFLVVFWRSSDRYSIQVDFILLVQGQPLPAILDSSFRTFGTALKKSTSLVVRATP